jgi:hypothetical protein
MATTTSRLALVKPAGTENKQLSVINSNYDTIDSAVGVQWVADGALPAKQYVGAKYKELTSLKELTLKDNGVGGFTPVSTECYASFTSSQTVPNAASYGVNVMATSFSNFPSGAITIALDTLTISLPGNYLITFFADHQFVGSVTGRSFVAIKEGGYQGAKSSYATGENQQSCAYIARVASGSTVVIAPEVYLTWGGGTVNFTVRIVRLP